MNRRAFVAKAALLGFGLTSCKTLPLDSLLQSIKRPTVESVTPRVTGTDIRGIGLAFDVKVRNPNTYPIVKGKCKYTIEIEGEEFLDTDKKVDVNLPAQGSGIVTFPARLSFPDLFRAFRHLRGKNEAAYLMRGYLTIAGIPLPIRATGTIPLR